MQNNTAFVATLKNLRKIEGADKILQADVTLKDVVVTSIVTGVDAKENSLVVYFDANMCLSDEFIQKVDPDLSRYLSKGNRVKVVKLRGCISNGLVVDIHKFSPYYTLNSSLESELIEGFSFNNLGSHEICHKYVSPIKVESCGSNKSKGKKGKKGKVISRMIDGQFAFHGDTAQLARNAHVLNPDMVISISEKWHGTSAICSNALVRKKETFRDRIARLISGSSTSVEYDYIYASRTVVKNGKFVEGHTGYYGEDIWTLCGEKYFKGRLHKGESVYYEIVGYTPSGKYIQKNFNYGCNPNQCTIRVYRITKTGVDGDVVEYGWQAMKDRCAELGVSPVKELYFGKARDLFKDLNVSDHWNQNFISRLRDTYLEKDLECNIGVPVPDEGIVLRIESKYISVFKLKSEKFYLYESKAHDAGDSDMEEDQAPQVLA